MKKTALLLFFLLPLLLFAGCGKGAGDPADPSLTGWELLKRPLPEGFAVGAECVPSYDAARDEILCFAFSHSAGNGADAYENRLFRLGPDGVTEEKSLPLPPDERILLGAFGEDAAFFVTSNGGPVLERWRLYRYAYGRDGELLPSVPLAPFYPDGVKTDPRFLALDGEGRIYAGVSKAVLVFDEKLDLVSRLVPLSSEMEYLALLSCPADGTVWVSNTWSISGDGGRCLSPLDPEDPSGKIPYGSEYTSDGEIPLFPLSEGDGFDLYGWNDAGLAGLKRDPNGGFDRTPLADFDGCGFRFRKKTGEAGQYRVLAADGGRFLCSLARMREGLAVCDLWILQRAE